MSRTLSSRLRFAAISGLVAVVLLELVLQALAWIVHATYTPAAPVPSDGRVVVCVGDSFTFGMGAKTPAGSYPAQLERVLHESGATDCTVVNRGRPGRNSEEACHVVRAALAEFEPVAVCLMVGVNDQWSDCAVVPLETSTGDAAARGFRWEYRTLRMLRVLFGGQELFVHRGSADAAGVDSVSTLDEGLRPLPDDPLIGRWTFEGTGVPISFQADGSAYFAGRLENWRRIGADVVLGALQPVRFTVERSERGVSLRGANGESMRLVAAGSFEPWMFDEAVAAEDWSRAVELAERRLAAADAIEARVDLAYARARSAIAQDVDGVAERELDALREFATTTDVSRAARFATQVALSLGDDRLGFEIVTEGLERHEDDAWLWQLYGRIACTVLDADAARLAVDRALERVDEPELCVELLRLAMRLLRDDSDAVAECLVRAHRLAPASESVRRLWRRALRPGEALGEAHIRRAGQRLGFGTTQLDDVLVFARDVSSKQADWSTTLASNLESIVRLCRSRGVHVVVGDYPFRVAALDEVIHGTAERLGVSVASIHASFPPAGEARDALFVADGHCNDAGYAHIATCFAHVLLTLIGDAR